MPGQVEPTAIIVNMPGAGDSKFKEFSDELGLFDRLNNHESVVDVPAPLLAHEVLVFNTTRSAEFRLLEAAQIVDIDEAVGNLFEPILKLHSPKDFEDARRACSVDSNALLDRFDSVEKFSDAQKRQYKSMEENGTWGRAYEELVSHGNAARDAEATLSVSEKVEALVVCSAMRKHYFTPRFSEKLGCYYAGGQSLSVLLETPMLFLLPTTAMWGPEMVAKFGHPERGPFGELVDFERTRYHLMTGFPFQSDNSWDLWKACGSCTARCQSSRGNHFELQESCPKAGHKTPCVSIYSTGLFGAATANASCTCARSGSVVLCSRATHRHTAHARTNNPVCGQRTGVDNQCIVAAGLFGAATRERWLLLLDLCGTLKRGRHPTELVDAFLEAVGNEPRLRALIPCLREFSYTDSSATKPCKTHGAPTGNPPKFACQQGSESHAAERFYLYDPLALTLALLMFVESTMSVGWINVWRIWVAAVQCHANCCPFCSFALKESLYRVIVYNAMIPVLPVTMATMLEQLANSMHCNQAMYRN